MKARGDATLRGCEKRIYYVKNTGSELFEEAYLVLKRKDSGGSSAPRGLGYAELEREAARILNSAAIHPERTLKAQNKTARLRAFLAGAAFSLLLSLAVAGVCLIFAV